METLQEPLKVRVFRIAVQIVLLLLLLLSRAAIGNHLIVVILSCFFVRLHNIAKEVDKWMLLSMG